MPAPVLCGERWTASAHDLSRRGRSAVQHRPLTASVQIGRGRVVDRDELDHDELARASGQFEECHFTHGLVQERTTDRGRHRHVPVLELHRVTEHQVVRFPFLGVPVLDDDLGAQSHAVRRNLREVDGRKLADPHRELPEASLHQLRGRVGRSHHQAYAYLLTRRGQSAHRGQALALPSRAEAAARARLEDKEIKRLEAAAARYKVWAVKNPDLNKRKNAVESRIARIEKDRTQLYTQRERRLELADGNIDARVALRLANLDVKTIKDPTRPANVGLSPPNVARHQANLWNRYAIGTGPLKGLGLGVGVIHVGERRGNNNLPNLMILSLPNDHTAGTAPDFPTPNAMVADNDLALGRIIDLITHSKYWDSTVVFITEDDSQSGWDHISAYRTVGLVVSPYSAGKLVTAPPELPTTTSYWAASVN